MSASPVAVFRSLTAGVHVIGVAHGGGANAFTAAWLMQVSFDPLLLALSINPEHASYPLLRKGGVFTVNVLQQGQLDLARRFGCQSARDGDKLAGIPTRAGRLGAPILLEAAAYLECRVTEQMTAGDHELVVGQVVAGDVLIQDAEPLRYADTGNLDGSADLYPRAWPSSS